MKRLEDLTQDSAALRVHLLPQLKALNHHVPELVNFGISVRVYMPPPSRAVANVFHSSLRKRSCRI